MNSINNKKKNLKKNNQSCNFGGIGMRNKKKKFAYTK